MWYTVASLLPFFFDGPSSPEQEQALMRIFVSNCVILLETSNQARQRSLGTKI
jgi:hypothetical protein